MKYLSAKREVGKSIFLKMALIQVEVIQVMLTAIIQMVSIIITILVLEGVSDAMRQHILLNFARIIIREIFSNRGHSECSGVKVTL